MTNFIRLYRTALPLLLVLAGPGSPAAAETHPWIFKKGQTRIMCLGNSITQWLGWRLYLQDSLRANGYTYHYVGGNYLGLGSEGYNSFHSGLSGVLITELPNGGLFNAGNAEWKAAQPDLILLEIGTNDIRNASSTAPADLSNLLDRIWADVPNAIILVATITPFTAADTANNQRVDAFNAQVPSIVAQKAAQGRKVMMVDIHSSITSAPANFVDMVHPNDQAHRKMAARWYEGVTSITIDTADYPPGANLPPIVQATVTPTYSPVPFTTPNTILRNPSFIKTINVGETVHLYGRLVDAGAASATGIAYAWSMAHGPGVVTFATPASLTTDVVFPGAGQFGLCLTATRNGLTGRAYCRVIVNKPGGGDDYAPGTYGKAIGINLSGRTGLAATETAGVVPRANWSTFGCLQPSNQYPLTQSDGVALSTTLYDQVVNVCGTYSQRTPVSTPDGKLLGTGLWSRDGQRHRIWNIPYPRYDLFLYFSYTKSGNDVYNNAFLIREMLDDQWVAGPYYAGNMPNFDGTLARLSTNGVVDGANAPKANYLVVPNLTVKDLYILLAPSRDTWPYASNYVNLDGIQVVQRTDSIPQNAGAIKLRRSPFSGATLRAHGLAVVGPGALTIADLSGRVHLSRKVQSGTCEVSLSGFHQGTYVVSIASAAGVCRKTRVTIIE